MSNGIYVALSGSVAIEKNMEVTSNNLANASTTGFKKDKAIFKEYLHKYRNSEIEPQMEENGAIQDKTFTELFDVFTDFSGGGAQK